MGLRDVTLLYKDVAQLMPPRAEFGGVEAPAVAGVAVVTRLLP